MEKSINNGEKSKSIETPLSKKRRSQESLDKFDPNGDDNISSAELGACSTARLVNLSPRRWRVMMSGVDHDGGDYVDPTEFKIKRIRTEYLSAIEAARGAHELGEDCSIKDYRRMISSCGVAAMVVLTTRTFTDEQQTK
ncbi:hypothetical protein DH2020_002082 [Rehmannia glutinosa]|uniref:EF-hand domain-containing protein n=1 Tax=Rehmannia glutinosa TaxID=99300 RepID=A0ABR0XTA6_REHGL